MVDRVWIFMGDGAGHPAAVFSTKDRAEAWIEQWKVSGTLTAYPMDQSVYDWAIAEQLFAPKYPNQIDSSFVQRFSSAYAEHYHYVAGTKATK